MRQRFSYLLIIFLAFSCTSCATHYNIATGKREIMFIDNNAEARVGQNISREYETKFKISSSPAYNARMQKVGGRLINSIDRRGINYKFKVVEDENMNAFTIPGGYIYATTGLFEGVDSDDELAAVLGHEIGHSEARHAVKHLESAVGYTTLMNIAYVLDPREEDKKQDWAYISTGAGAVYSLISLGYSRKDEYAADRLSIVYLEQSGYDSGAVITLLEKLKARQNGKDVKWLYFIRSHPFIDERIEAARVEMQHMSVVSPSSTSEVKF